MVSLVANPERFAERVRDFYTISVKKPDLVHLLDCDILQAVPQTEVWVAAKRSEGGWAVGMAKYCGHEIPLEDYPRKRVRMRAGEASRLARRWGKEVSVEHPAYDEVECVAQSLGVATRRSYVVVALDDAAARHDPNQSHEYDLAELVAGITPDNRHEPVDFGPPVGKEAW